MVRKILLAGANQGDRPLIALLTYHTSPTVSRTFSYRAGSAVLEKTYYSLELAYCWSRLECVPWRYDHECNCH